MFGAEDTVGIAASIRALRLGAEHSVGSVDRYAFEVAFGSREEAGPPVASDAVAHEFAGPVTRVGIEPTTY